jgi:hypothetical protein
VTPVGDNNWGMVSRGHSVYRHAAVTFSIVSVPAAAATLDNGVVSLNRRHRGATRACQTIGAPWSPD